MDKTWTYPIPGLAQIADNFFSEVLAEESA
jgi:hypothetical protein